MQGSRGGVGGGDAGTGLGEGEDRVGMPCGDTREGVKNGRSAFAHAATELSKPKPASKLLPAFTCLQLLHWTPQT